MKAPDGFVPVFWTSAVSAIVKPDLTIGLFPIGPPGLRPGVAPQLLEVFAKCRQQ
jgi:hypothetical protein